MHFVLFAIEPREESIQAAEISLGNSLLDYSQMLFFQFVKGNVSWQVVVFSKFK